MKGFRCLGFLGPIRALINPRAQQSDLPGGQRITLLRHLHVRHETGDEVNERAVRAVLRFDGRRVIFSALERGFAVVQAKAAPLFVRAVAGLAGPLEDGANVFREIHRPGRGRRELRQVQD